MSTAYLAVLLGARTNKVQPRVSYVNQVVQVVGQSMKWTESTAQIFSGASGSRVELRMFLGVD